MCKLFFLKSPVSVLNQTSVGSLILTNTLIIETNFIPPDTSAIIRYDNTGVKYCHTDPMSENEAFFKSCGIVFPHLVAVVLCL